MQLTLFAIGVFGLGYVIGGWIGYRSGYIQGWGARVTPEGFLRLSREEIAQVEAVMPGESTRVNGTP